MPFETRGIHHVTAIAGDAQANLDFYVGLLGLRLVKRTVNFDDPGTYHFYFGDATGRPGSLLTFFPWAGMPRGRPGPGQVTRVSFLVPAASLGWWERRFADRGMASTRPDERTITFEDPDGMSLALVADETARPETEDGAWAGGPVPAEHVPLGLHGVTIEVARAERSIELLTESLGFGGGSSADAAHRLVTRGGGMGSRVEVLERPGAAPGRLGAGTVHHVAFRARDDAEQNAWREKLARRGLGVTPVQDRCYFHSIYFREPGGVLYEIATDPPGFTIDESAAELGGALKLPPWLEEARGDIERSLPVIRLPQAERVP
jgi:glyoxalase family protein